MNLFHFDDINSNEEKQLILSFYSISLAEAYVFITRLSLGCTLYNEQTVAVPCTHLYFMDFPYFFENRLTAMEQINFVLFDSFTINFSTIEKSTIWFDVVTVFLGFYL